MTIDTKPRTAASAGKTQKQKAASAALPVTPQPPRMPGRRNPKWIALGIVALCLGGPAVVHDLCAGRKRSRGCRCSPHHLPGRDDRTG